MGWERRSRGGWYYTRSKRVSGRVVREYVGTGLLGAVAADMDAEERGEHEAEREALRAEQERWGDMDAAVAQVCEATDLMARTALVLAGYHQHHRGEWRKRRT